MTRPKKDAAAPVKKPRKMKDCHKDENEESKNTTNTTNKPIVIDVNEVEIPSEQIEQIEQKEQEQEEKDTTMEVAAETIIDDNEKVTSTSLTVKKKGKNTTRENDTGSKRKKKNNFVCSTYHLNSDIDNITPMSDDENIIMQLNVKPDEKEDEMFVYDLYNNRHNNSFAEEFSFDKGGQTPRTESAHILNTKEPYEIFDHAFLERQRVEGEAVKEKEMHDEEPETNKVVKLLKDFEEKNKQNEWPMSTNISCYWCCHRFFNEPVGIPIKYADEKFHVFGCFCSLECAQAHNYSMRDGIDEMWERSNLINMLSRKLKYNKHGFVKPAPPRLALKMFGGHLSIEEFRNFSQKSKIMNINFPPMLTVTQQIEEINECEVNSDYKFIPIDTERINKYKEKMRLKRTKPIHDLKNTLDNAINIKITSTQSKV